jgi:hypothetical protein
MTETPRTMSVSIEGSDDPDATPDTMSAPIDEPGGIPETMSVPVEEPEGDAPIPRTMSVAVDEPDETSGR